MSQPDVIYSCGSCGYALNLTSSNRVTSAIGSKYQKSIKKGLISFRAVDLSRFTQVDEVNCFPIPFGRYGPKTKLLCRQCGVLIGYKNSENGTFCGSGSSSSVRLEYTIKIGTLQPLDDL